jgi:DNA-binding CsgD family transcriptional regulator
LINPTSAANASVSVEQLMELATVISDLTATPRAFDKVAAFMADMFGMEVMSIAVVDVLSTIRPSRVVMESCYANGVANGAIAPVVPMHESQSIDDHVAEANTDAVMNIAIDTRHKLVVQFRTPANWHPGVAATFTIALRHLVKTIRATVMWQSNPQSLGQPYDRLTEREWTVLVGLNSEDGEKQLADRLSLSPHTLHSHIKSIYRKLGVQGRLSLMQKFSMTLVDYRRRVLALSMDSPSMSN